MTDMADEMEEVEMEPLEETDEKEDKGRLVPVYDKEWYKAERDFSIGIDHVRSYLLEAGQYSPLSESDESELFTRVKRESLAVSEQISVLSPSEYCEIKSQVEFDFAVDELDGLLKKEESAARYRSVHGAYTLFYDKYAENAAYTAEDYKEDCVELSTQERRRFRKVLYDEGIEIRGFEKAFTDVSEPVRDYGLERVTRMRVLLGAMENWQGKNMVSGDTFEENKGLLVNCQERFGKLKDLWQKQSLEARHIICECSLRQVVGIARRYEGRGVPFLDLVQEGNMGLMRSVDKFDMGKDKRFGTYASYWVRHYMAKSLGEQSHDIRLPAHLEDSYHKILSTASVLQQEKGEEPTVAEVAERMKMPKKKVLEILGNVENRNAVSLDKAIETDDDSVSLMELVEDKSSVQPHEVLVNNDYRAKVLYALDDVKDMEKQVLSLRYGLDDGRVRSLEQLSHYFGITKEEVRNYEERGLKQLHSSLIKKNRSVDKSDDKLSYEMKDVSFADEKDDMKGKEAGKTGEKEIVSGVALGSWDGDSVIELGVVSPDGHDSIFKGFSCNGMVNDILKKENKRISDGLADGYSVSGGTRSSSLVERYLDSAKRSINDKASACAVEHGLYAGDTLFVSLEERMPGGNTEKYMYELEPTKVSGLFVGVSYCGDEIGSGAGCPGVFIVQADALDYLSGHRYGLEDVERSVISNGKVLSKSMLGKELGSGIPVEVRMPETKPGRDKGIV